MSPASSMIREDRPLRHPPAQCTLPPGPPKIVFRHVSAETGQTCVVCRGVHYYGDIVTVHGDSTVCCEPLAFDGAISAFHIRTTAAVSVA